jgi:Sec-independent protein translocase protein TatA
MDFLGVGPAELFYILVIALIILGPKDMVKAGRTLGRWLRAIVTSPSWQTIQKTSRDLRYLPNKLMREAGLDEQIEEINKIQKDLPSVPSLGLESINQEFQQVRQDLNQELRQATADLSSWTTPPEDSALLQAGTDNTQEPAEIPPASDAAEPVSEPKIEPEAGSEEAR